MTDSPGATTRRQFVARAMGVLSGALLATAAGCSPEPEAGSIEDLLTEKLPDGASLTAIAARRGEIVYCAGTGMADREAGIRAGRDTVYDIGSITKQFTATAILKLAMAGALSTADPIARFVDVPEDKRGITLHQLLTHTAGLPDQLGDDYDVLTRSDMLAAAARSDLRAAPGEEYHYSNVGYSVLAAVVELVSGLGYEEYLATNLFTPAGMTHTGYLLPRWDTVAVEYDDTGAPRGRPNERPWDTDGPYWNLRGNGGILSTAPDMYRWHRALAGQDILSETAKKKLFEPYVREEQDGDSYYGYGWVIMFDDGDRIAWHNGGNDRSYAELARYVDDELMVFWATNQVAGGDGWHLDELDLTQGMVAVLRQA